MRKYVRIVDSSILKMKNVNIKPKRKYQGNITQFCTAFSKAFEINAVNRFLKLDRTFLVQIRYIKYSTETQSRSATVACKIYSVLFGFITKISECSRAKNLIIQLQKDNIIYKCVALAIGRSKKSLFITPEGNIEKR